MMAQALSFTPMPLPPREALEQAGARFVDAFDGVCIELPCRGRDSLTGTVLLIFGGFVTTLMLVWVSGPLRGALRSDGGIRWFLLLFALMGLPGLAYGPGVLFAAFAAWFGKTRAGSKWVATGSGLPKYPTVFGSCGGGP